MDKRKHFFERSGLPFWDAYFEENGKKVYYDYFFYDCHKSPEQMIREMQTASVKVAQVFDHVASQIPSWSEKDFSKWQFHKDYMQLLQSPWDDIFCMRVGWGWQGDQLKFFEINSQTPSLWPEIESGTPLLAKEFGLKNPNTQSLKFLKKALNQSIAKRVLDLPEALQADPVVGFVTSNYWEDIYIMRWLATFCDFRYEVLHIGDLDFTQPGNMPFNRQTGKQLNALLFWYPIEWMDDLKFANGDYVWEIFFDGLERKEYVMVHGIPAFFIQSKAILAYITENANSVFKGDLQSAEQYFPKTYLSNDALSDNFIAKPIWGREGRGSFIINQGEKMVSRYQEDYYVNQPKVYQELLSLPKISYKNQEYTAIYEAWVYKVDGKWVPGNIGIRACDHFITDDNCFALAVGV